ncbi:gluconolaconase [Mycolicibacterium elephantis]|uniref:Gluconolaconase n=2 Tax=Mycolicibacterium elephantis TaxID=81858 RepID=A0A1X0D9N0_9MYCO|nr:SMP-30/gluconolactonase/LRE family protein [Mycolicibacterium elephantis]ORA68899.1 gluconolaconase [Mycolicibacterium elephantis]
MRTIVSSAEPLTAQVTYHGEGPFWDPISGRLHCLNVLAGEVITMDPSGAVSRLKVPSRVASVIRRRATGGFVIATEHGLIGANNDLSEFEPIVTLIDNPTIRTNDGGCDPLGGFIIGTMAYDERRHGGAVYRISHDHRVTEVLSSVSISNGVQWSPSGREVFYIDTPTRRVDVFDVDPETGMWSGRRTHIRTDCMPGYPDGMAIDEDGGLWIAMWGGGVVSHYDATGDLVETVEVPGVSQVSSCTFGGDRFDLLFITTSRQGLADDEEPLAGAVFVVDTESQGLQMSAFAG